MKNSFSTWQLASEDADYPEGLRAHAKRWPTIYGIGNREIFKCSPLGLICSVQCPGSVVIKTFDAVRELRDFGIAVAGGFHSPMEHECLEFLLRGKQPVIVCLARGLGNRIDPMWRTAIDAGRMLIISPFNESTKRVTKELAQERNEVVAGLAKAVLIPYASPGGKVAALATRLASAGKPVITFGDSDALQPMSPATFLYQLDRIARLIGWPNQ